MATYHHETLCVGEEEIVVIYTYRIRKESLASDDIDLDLVHDAIFDLDSTIEGAIETAILEDIAMFDPDGEEQTPWDDSKFSSIFESNILYEQ